MNNRGVTIAFLGDSVTQGCFEFCKKNKDVYTVFDKNSAYHNYIAKIFSILFPTVPVNIINAGISGGTCKHGLERIERDVLQHNPDLTVVCFGLNDVKEGIAGLKEYTSALEKIFCKLKQAGSEIIFMTPNMMNTNISPYLEKKEYISIAKVCKKIQCEGVMDAYMEAAKDICYKNNVVVCDCYSKWKVMKEIGIDTTELLANKINHPTREMNWLFAIMLVDIMIEK